jgi:hypothetical protein
MVGRLVKLALLVGVLTLLGVALFRPATLFGVDAKALANSLGDEVAHSQARCVKDRSGGWRCALSGESVAGIEYALETHRWGCWSATRVATPAGDKAVARTVSGCVGLTDLFGS